MRPMLVAMNLLKPLLPVAVAAAIGGGVGAVATTALHDDTPAVRTITNTRTVAAATTTAPGWRAICRRATAMCSSSASR